MSQLSHRAIELGPPGGDIGKKDLHTVVRRFQNLHKLRLQRIQDFLLPRQRIFLEVLPLLFHINHQMLPGFVANETPAGIPDYTPSRRALSYATRLSKTFNFQRRALREYPIQGLYLMGSGGSIAYSKHSDLDVWLCHDPELPPEALTELREKAAAIDVWSESLQLQTHIFLVNADEFRAGQGTQPLSKESSGSTQHYLLLEEFYRTGIFLAGRVPVWWLVPPEQEYDYSRYVAHLKNKRFINDRETLDFGGLEDVPHNEFIGATLWHLYKSITAPHKSLLKLLLMESYAAEYPRPEWLSICLKRAIFSGTVDIDELDPYVLMYRKVEQYLSRHNNPDRLELARRCFYLKINELLSVKTAQAERLRRRELLERLMRDWRWSHAHLRELDSRRHWDLRLALAEQEQFADELTRSFEHATRLVCPAGSDPSSDGREIHLLGRKLHAVLERKPGKIDRLTKDSHDHIAIDALTLAEQSVAAGQTVWALYVSRNGLSDHARQEPIRTAGSAVELLSWLVMNDMYRPTLPINLELKNSRLSVAELRHLCKTLCEFRAGLAEVPDGLHEFAQPPTILSAALFVNVGHHALAGLPGGMQIASSRFDPLSYGAARESLIYSIDVVAFNSWQETRVTRYVGVNGLVDCLCELLNQRGSAAPTISAHCFASSRATSLALRVAEVWQSLAKVCTGSQLVRYVLPAERNFVLFYSNAGTVRWWTVPDHDALYQELESPRPAFTGTAFDPWASDQALVARIYGHLQPGVIHIFGVPGKNSFDIYIVDERGALFRAAHEPLDPNLIFGPYAQLLGNLMQRYALQTSGLACFLTERNELGELRFVQFRRMSPTGRSALNVRIAAQDSTPANRGYTIFCNDLEFSFLEHGDNVFARAAQHILELRKSGQAYPIYVTDLDLPLPVLGVEKSAELQTIHLLKLKRKIEERLNAPLKTVG